MDFKSFTDDLLAQNITTQDIASRLGVSQNTILRARMDPSSPNARPAPKEWEDPLRELAKERAASLRRIARRAR